MRPPPTPTPPHAALHSEASGRGTKGRLERHESNVGAASADQSKGFTPQAGQTRRATRTFPFMGHLPSRRAPVWTAMRSCQGLTKEVLFGCRYICPRRRSLESDKRQSGKPPADSWVCVAWIEREGGVSLCLCACVRERERVIGRGFESCFKHELNRPRGSSSVPKRQTAKDQTTLNNGKTD